MPGSSERRAAYRPVRSTGSMRTVARIVTGTNIFFENTPLGTINFFFGPINRDEPINQLIGVTGVRPSFGDAHTQVL